MSENKKYYYIKLKDNYFDQDNIKVLEAIPNGHIYSLIVVKLYLKATKYGGQLKMTESIPYDPKKIDILASVLNHDVAHVKEAIRLSSELGIISIFDTGEIWMSEIQNFIGHSSSEADRKRAYRKKLIEEEIEEVGHLSDVRPPEKEIEIETEIETEINKVEKFNFKKSLLGLGVEKEVVDDWMKVRKNKGATNTEISFNTISSQIKKSKYSATQCIMLSIVKDWKGFNNAWIKKEDEETIEGFASNEEKENKEELNKKLQGVYK